jgi:hypothetical protein
LDGFFRAKDGKPTLVDLCYSLFGPSSSAKPLEKRCRSLRTPQMGNLSFPEPGPYVLNAWAIDNVDDKFLSPMKSVAFDRLPSNLFEEGMYATEPHSPGFPNVLEHTGCSSLILASNIKLFGTTKENDTPLMYRPSTFDSGGGIDYKLTPLNIHAYWWNGLNDMTIISKKSTKLLKHLTTWSSSWTRYQPKWTYRVWDRLSIENVYENDFSGIFYGLWSRLSNNVDKINLSKYMVMLLHGGVSN